MKLEDQVVNLELSKKLYELGVIKESLFYWCGIDSNSDSENPYPRYCDTMIESSDLSAFTSEELGEIIPSRIQLKGKEPFDVFRLRIEKILVQLPNDKVDMYFNYVYSINYYCDSTELEGEDAWLVRKLFQHNFYDENEANARAEMLINLIENGYINNEQV